MRRSAAAAAGVQALLRKAPRKRPLRKAPRGRAYLRRHAHTAGVNTCGDAQWYCRAVLNHYQRAAVSLAGSEGGGTRGGVRAGSARRGARAGRSRRRGGGVLHRRRNPCQRALNRRAVDIDTDFVAVVRGSCFCAHHFPGLRRHRAVARCVRSGKGRRGDSEPRFESRPALPTEGGLQ